MPIILAPNADKGDIVQAVNYLLGTQAGVNSVVINTTTGAIINPYTQQNVGYAFKYMFVAYGTSNTGENFSLTSTNATYYGVRNTDSTVLSTNPADYTWSLASPAFGTTNFLYYSTIGGRQIQFSIDDTLPAASFALAPSGTPINLDIITSAGSAVSAVTVTGNAQPNITSVGTLTTLSVTGNISASNLNITGNISGNITPTTFILPRLTTTQITALTPVAGMLVYNTTIDKVQGYQTNALGVFEWVSLSVSTYQ